MNRARKSFRILSEREMANRRRTIKRQLRSMGYTIDPDISYTLLELRNMRKRAFFPHIWTRRAQ